MLGPQVLDLVQPTGLVDGLSVLGLSMLMFLAGYELKLDTIRGRPLKLAGISWGLSVVLAAVVGLGVHVSGGHSGEIVIPLALTTTALGTLLPVLRDAGVLGTPLGRYAMALGSVGEFGPIVLVGLLLAGTDPVQSILVLAALRPPHRRLRLAGEPAMGRAGSSPSSPRGSGPAPSCRSG